VRYVPTGAAAGRGGHRWNEHRRARWDRARAHPVSRSPASRGPAGRRRASSASGPHAGATSCSPGPAVGGPVLGLWRALTGRRPLLHHLRDGRGVAARGRYQESIVRIESGDLASTLVTLGLEGGQTWRQ
jgi:hypothetical protein